MIEGTPEFNRGFNAIVGDLNPQLDGQEYKPAPIIVEDDHTGFDTNGDYHAIRNGAALDPTKPPDVAYRIAFEIQEHVLRQETPMDQDQRLSTAADYADMLFEQNAFDPPEIAFSALNTWLSIFGGSHE